MTSKEFIQLKYPDSSVKKIHVDSVIKELYYNLAVLNKKDIDTKKLISLSNEFIPLYDIFSKNFYIINVENIHNRVINFHYRLPDENIIQKLKDTIEKINDDSLTNYREKLEKNINFIENFDLDTLQKNYYKHYYLSQPSTSELTSCIKPSFIPFMTKKPYYTKPELINMSLNLDIKIDDDYNNICSIISKNDIDASTILIHQQYIKNNAKSYIQLYTLLGSWYWNFYIRNSSCKRDIHVEHQIEKLYSVVKSSPAFKKSHYVYRFIDNDDYLQHMKVGMVFEESSFISTTRNPFYDMTTHIFGFILIKILLPKNVTGSGLCVESYSLFPNEEEILLNPSKLKLISKNENFHYYHPNKNASKRIKTMYVFEYVEMLELKDTSMYETFDDEIPTMSWLTDINSGDDFESKLYNFYRNTLTTYNDKRYFYTYIGKEKYLFQCFFLDDNPTYEKYFFLQQGKNTKPEIYFILQDDITGNIILLIELRNIISVNYIHKFVGSDNLPFNDDELLEFLSSLGKYFVINEIIVHDIYKSYDNISTKLLKNNDQDIFNDNNPDNHIVSLYSGDFNYYNSSMIDFIENKKKRFSDIDDITGVTYNLKNHHINRYKNIMAIEIFENTEKTPLYNILLKLNKQKQHNLIDFYLYIHYNYFYLIKDLNDHLINYDRDIFTDVNKSPWINSHIILNAEEYLYNKKLIPILGTFKSNTYHDYLKKLGEEHTSISFSKFRLNYI